MPSLKVRELALFLGVSSLVGCENTPPSGPPSPASTPGIETPKAEPTGGVVKRGGRAGATKKVTEQGPVVPD